MIPRRFSCLNYCQHAGAHSWDFTGSVIGLLGKNGTGKSNLLKAISVAITGEFDRSKERTITFGEETGEIEFTFEVRPGLLATVNRQLHNERATLKFQGDGAQSTPKNVTGVKAVNQAILELLGTDKTILQRIVFVPQDELASLLFTSPTENARLANRFFGLERAVQIEKALSERIGAVPVLPLPGDPVVLDQELNVLREALQQQGDGLEQQAADLNLRETNELLAGIRAFNADRDAAAAAERHLARRTQLEEQIAGAGREHDELQGKIDQMAVETLRARYTQEAEKRRQHETRVAVLVRRERLLGERASESQRFMGIMTLSADQERTMEDRLLYLQGLESGNDVIRREQDALLDRTEAEDGATCPVCLKPARWVEEEIQPILDDQAKPRGNAETLAEIARLRRDLSNHRSLRETHERKLGSLEDALERVDAEIALLGDDQGEGEPERWERALKQYDGLRERLSRLVGDGQRLERELAALVAAAPPTPAGATEGFDLAQAQARLGELHQQEYRRLECQHRREQLQGQIAAKSRELDAATAVQERNSANAKYRETLKRLRATFHPDGAPAELVGRRVARMVPRINEYLAALNCPFRARAADGFNFEYVWAAEPDFPRQAVELSGGQRTATSVAFRLAALQSFGASVGMLVLDEASQALDQEKVGLFASLLESLKPLAVRLGVTFIFVTHSAELESAFDQTIQL